MSSRVAPPLLLLLYAALLRFDALVSKYGFIDGPAHVVAVERRACALARRLSPPGLEWPAGRRHGDPVSYLKIARAKTGFYEANAREPLAIAPVQFFLWLTGGQEIAINCVSALYSALGVLGAFLLGALAFSPGVGLAAGCLLAVEAWVITFGVDGWRDEGFAFFAVMTAYALVRLRRSPSPANAAVAGLFATGACLTRLTSFSLAVPALAYVVIDGPRDRWRKRAFGAAFAFVIVATLVAPYLVNNAIAYNDPFYSFDVATELYRERGRLPVERPMAWTSSFAERFTAHPLATVDSLLQGCTTYPWRYKWQGFSYLSLMLPKVLSAAAAAGLLLFLATADGRLLLVVLFGALAPFAVVWQAPAAAQWRLTSFAYPFYLIAAVHALRTATSLASPRFYREWMDRLRSYPGRSISLALALPLAIVLLPRCWQYLLVREAALTGGEYSIVAGIGDGWFFGNGWYGPVRSGNVTGRYSHGSAATMFIPIFQPAESRLVFRLQACSPESKPSRELRVSVNGEDAGTFRAVWDPNRAGAYEVAVPKALIRSGWNRIDLRADGSSVIPVGESRFMGLEPGQDTAFFLWYLRVAPAPRGGEPSSDHSAVSATRVGREGGT
jgi:dolichyl-phosphate-mannose-protein mannosyltransferase